MRTIICTDLFRNPNRNELTDGAVIKQSRVAFKAKGCAASLAIIGKREKSLKNGVIFELTLVFFKLGYK